MKKLFVYYEEQIVGKLIQDEELVCSFEYAESWRNSDDSFPLSLSMPLEEKSFGNKVTLSFFENLLPEGDVRKSLEDSQGIKGAFPLLEEFGKDCAGAIVFSESDNYKHEIDPSRKQEVSLDNIYQAIGDKVSVADIIAKSNPGYLSLAGAQDKFPAIFEKGKFYLPLAGAPTTHIVKTPIWRQGVKESVYNEFYCMELARRVGFDVPICQIIEGQFPLFVIERYDRFLDNEGKTRRMHQQDFCQAQGFLSDKKYEEKGGPGLKQNYELIVNSVSSKSRLKNINIFLDWLGFNLLIGNNDSHSKNISFLMKETGIELAPLYDLLCTSIYPKLKRQFSFEIGGKSNFSHIGKKEFEILDGELGLKAGFFASRIGEMNKKIQEEKDLLAKEISATYSDVKIVNNISLHIGKRSKSLIRQKAF